MIKTVRKGSVREQDVFRREDVVRMSAAERINALIHARDRAVDAGPLKKVAHRRKLH